MSGIEGPGITGGGGSAPSTEDFVTYSTEVGLPNSRVLTAGTNITLSTSTPGQISVSSSASATPGGVNTNIQYNNSGAFGGSANLTWDDALNTLTVSGAELPDVNHIQAATGEYLQVSGGNVFTDATYAFARLGGGEGASGNGGDLRLQAGPGVTVGDGGSVAIVAGNGAGSGSGGYIVLTAGHGSPNATIDFNTGSPVPATRLSIGAVGEIYFDGDAGGAGTVLTSAGGAAPPTWSALAAAGADTQIQFNDSGDFGASSKLTWNDTVSLLTVGDATGGAIGTGTTGSVFISGGNPLTDTTAGFFAAAGGAGTSGNGGAITITAGSGQTAGAGGGVSINAGAGVGGSNAGGVTIAAGSATGGGTSGSIVLHAGGANRVVLFAGGELGIDGSNGTAGNVPVSAGAVGAATWGTVNLASSNAVTGDLPFANIAQGAALSVLGVTGNATADLASIAAASDGNVLRRSGTAVAFGAIALASANAVSGILAAANGGTGNGFTAFSGPTTSTKTFTLPNASATILTNDATITVTQGGTGISGYTQGDLIFAAGTSTLTTLGKSATASRYLSNSGASNNPAWAQVDLSNGVTGNLPVGNLNSGTSASSSTFWRGDATWGTPVAGGAVAGSNTQVQFNNSGAFGADADLTWTSSTNVLGVGSVATPGAITAPDGSSSVGAGIKIQAGAGNGSTNAGGSITLQAGVAAGAGTAGDLLFQTGSTRVLKYDVGQAVLEVGSTSVGTIAGQNGTSPADLDIRGGNNTVTAGGGACTIRAGGGGTTGAGGLMTVAGGFGGGTSGNGGGVTVVARNGGGGTSNGGSINITAGALSGAGSNGTITLNIGATQIVTFDSAPTTGAQTATFSATNKPGSATAGPTNWLKVINGGTTYWIPMFGN